MTLMARPHLVPREAQRRRPKAMAKEGAHLPAPLPMDLLPTMWVRTLWSLPHAEQPPLMPHRNMGIFSFCWFLFLSKTKRYRLKGGGSLGSSGGFLWVYFGIEKVHASSLSASDTNLEGLSPRLPPLYINWPQSSWRRNIKNTKISKVMPQSSNTRSVLKPLLWPRVGANLSK